MSKGGKGNNRHLANGVAKSYVKKYQKGYVPTMSVGVNMSSEESHPLSKYGPIELDLVVDDVKYCIIGGPDLRGDDLKYMIAFKQFLKASAAWSFASFAYKTVEGPKFFDISKGGKYDLVAVEGYGANKVFKQGELHNQEAEYYGVSSLQHLGTPVLDLRPFSHPLVEEEDFVLRSETEVGKFMLAKLMPEIVKLHGGLYDTVKSHDGLIKNVRDLNFLLNDCNKRVRFIVF